ncbi:MAG: hypothetical protein ACRER1_02360 [Gammaproteobacteria bacterium]
MPDNSTDPDIVSAECVLPAGNMADTLRFFIDELGFRLDGITPADDPALAQLSGHGQSLRLDAACRGAAGTLRLNTRDDCRREALTAPNGTRIEFGPATEPMIVPELQASLSIQRFNSNEDAWKLGRAGMQYRDLIPDRQGGWLIASHIRIPVGGPVADNVHHHAIRFQLIYCYRGWVRLVYEDQGAPFVMHAGDCVLQPPHIRHRVLEASDGLEVIEIGSPAAHMTRLDHDMTLPTGRHLPERDYGKQTYVFHRAAEAHWESRSGSGFETRDFGIAAATKKLVVAQVIRRSSVSADDDEATTRNKAFTFAFVLQGSLSLLADEQPECKLAAGDAFVIPANMSRSYKNCSDDLELLEVQLPT